MNKNIILDKDVLLTVPKLNLFIHNCYIQSARKMWKNAYLFDDVNIAKSIFCFFNALGLSTPTFSA